MTISEISNDYMLLKVSITLAGAMAIHAASAEAGCKNCQANAPMSMAPVAVDPMMTAAPMMSHDAMSYDAGFAMGGGGMGGAFSGHEPFHGYRSDHMPYASGHVHKIATPPGTIGRTYQLPTAPVPATMHPRTAVLKVLADGASEVTMTSANIMRTEEDVEGYQDPETGVWVFKTDPLYPGLPQIYRVRAKYGDGLTHKDRYVRLIMGRVSALAY